MSLTLPRRLQIARSPFGKAERSAGESPDVTIWLASLRPRKAGAASASETPFASFCRDGQPVTSVLIATAAVLVVLFITIRINARTPFEGFEAFYQWVKGNAVNLLFTVPSVIAAFRGRRYLRAIVLGRLSMNSMISIGVGTAIAVRMLSIVLDSGRYTFPIFSLKYLWDGTDGISALAAYLVYPFAEEMFYQVGIQTKLQRFGPFIAVLGSTAFFTGVHAYGGSVPMFDLLTKLLPSLLSFALVRQLTKSFGAAFIAHGFYNAFTSTLLEWSR